MDSKNQKLWGRYDRSKSKQWKEVHNRAWDRKFGEVAKYKKMFGRLPTTTFETEIRYHNLGAWLHTQRSAYRAGSLDVDRYAQLEALDMDWRVIRDRKRAAQLAKLHQPDKFWGSELDYWNFQLDVLKNFRKRYSKRWPRDSEEFPPGNKLGRWCNRVRRQNSKGMISDYWIRILSSLGFEWEDHIWMEQYKMLLEYRRKHPQLWPLYREEYPKGHLIGKWCHHQRQNYRIGKLSKERIRRLEEIDFPWVIR